MDPSSNATSQPTVQVQSPAVSFGTPPQGVVEASSSAHVSSLQPLSAPAIEPRSLAPSILSNPALTIVSSTPPTVSISLLLVSGRRRTLDFEPKVTIGELKEVVWSTWPSGMSFLLGLLSSGLGVRVANRCGSFHVQIGQTSYPLAHLSFASSTLGAFSPTTRLLPVSLSVTHCSLRWIDAPDHSTALNLPLPPETTVVHVSVRSFAPTSGDEDLKKKRGKRSTRRTRASGTDASAPAGAAGAGGETTTDASRGCCGCIIC